ncbi:MAG: 5-oxoprolinase/urea amidolyase family protein [Comamonadaceae bacterium]|nr:5-oxoprolinase/urea amidolyase family protein [Comamonadaceae bacterium]
MRVLPAGDAALLVELADLAHTLALYRALRSEALPGVRELVPAACTLLVQFEPDEVSAQTLAAAVRARARRLDGAALTATTPATTVEIPVHYEGEDLAFVAEHLGISVQEVIARHTGAPWQAAFAGFAPGFVYLAGGHPCFANLPRRATPRTRVPAGSVALAGDFSAVYPTASPGGWQLIGTTDAAMWDLARAQPALVQPGMQVRFRRADAGHVAPAPQPTAKVHEQNMAPALDGQAPAAIEIVNAGLQTLVQDLGRHGCAGLGISPSGALDAPALRLANRLVGNAPDLPVLEAVLGGLALRARGRVTLAVAGADAPLTLRAADGAAWPVRSHAPLALDDGDVLTLGAPAAGVRSYVALRGGWRVAPVLGSCSRDTLAQLGPAPLRTGDVLGVGNAPPHACAAPQTPRPDLPRAGDTVVLDVLLGPRSDWFTPEAIALLQRQHWRVTPQSNRVGMRLAGDAPLARARHEELPSEGTASGALQVPASGQPVLFLADHPLTGGYPVIAVLARHHLALAAQIPVGCSLRFRVIAPFEEV